MSKANCWEYHRCGRQPGGANAPSLGVCPASTESRLTGVNSGFNAGRACWAVAGTLCRGQIQGSTATKLDSCLECLFFERVMYEEAENVLRTGQIMLHLARADESAAS